MPSVSVSTGLVRTWRSGCRPVRIQGLLKDGICTGLGTVLGFLPEILVLFFFILTLEETGYLPRAAFLLDRLMLSVGLTGVPSFRCCRASPARFPASWVRAASKTRAIASPPFLSRR
jgi:hypothetical protein